MRFAFILVSVIAVHCGGSVTIIASDAAFRCGDCETCRAKNGEACYGVDREPGRPGKPHRELPGDVDRGDCPPYRYTMDDCQRAGNPHSVAPWARCGVNGKYSAWFVGGGAAWTGLPKIEHSIFNRGRGRKSNATHDSGEGTWGLDYGGLRSKANVWLNYTCGRKQGGEGAYRTDGEPKIVSKVKSLFEH